MLLGTFRKVLNRIDKKLAGILIFNFATLGIAVWSLFETIAQGRLADVSLKEAKNQTELVIEQGKDIISQNEKLQKNNELLSLQLEELEKQNDSLERQAERLSTQLKIIKNEAARNKNVDDADILQNKNISSKYKSELIEERLNSNKDLYNTNFGPFDSADISSEGNYVNDVKFDRISANNIKFKGSDLRGTWFNEIKVGNIIFEGVKKSGPLFFESSIENLKFIDAYSKGISLKSNSKISNLILENSNLYSFDIYSSKINNIIFNNSSVENVYTNHKISIGNSSKLKIGKFNIGKDTRLFNSIIKNSTIEYWNGSQSGMKNVSFEDSKIIKSRLGSVFFHNVSFKRTKIGKLYLSFTYIKNLEFIDSDISGSEFRNFKVPYLKEINFSGSNISEMRFDVEICSSADAAVLADKLSSAWSWDNRLPHIMTRCRGSYDKPNRIKSFKTCPSSLRAHYNEHQKFGIPVGC